MGRIKKSSKQFGLSTGLNSMKRKKLYPGRPQYRFRVTKPSNKCSPQKIILKISRNVKNKASVPKSLLVPLKQHVYAVYNTTDSKSVKVKLTKVSNVCGNGYRVINLDCLSDHVTEITVHACQCAAAVKLAACGKTPIKLVSELRTLGLATILLAECQGCRKTFRFETSRKLPHSRRYDINVRAVWGSMVTGNGPSHLNEFLGTLDSPGLSQNSFSAIEAQIGEWWRNILEQDMLMTGAEERQIAIDKGDYYGDVPSIAVITDGGWSKRTHKHSYNALGGVAIIIGKETKKLLHIGVRNKYCYICSTAETAHVEPKPHTCFKNWNESSQAMEADVIVEGFKLAESKHGVRYMQLIADGDSSVFAKIREEVPIWGRYVEKLECANHVCKCLRSRLEKLVSDNPMYKGKHHLTKLTRVRIVSAVRCAIRVRTKEAETSGNRQQALKMLRHDITNSVHHIFGYHDHCSDFCKVRKAADKPPDTSAAPPADPSTDTPADPPAGTSADTPGHTPGGKDVPDEPKETSDEVSDVIDDQVSMWTEGTSVTDQEESRYGSSDIYTDVEKFILQEVLRILAPVAPI